MKEKEFLEVIVIGGIHPVASIDVQPDISIAAWSVFEGESSTWPEAGTKTRHFVGYNLTDREGRVSTPIVAYDPKTKIGKTLSGRTYHLKGNPGGDVDALYVWGRFTEINKISNVKNVSEEYEACVDAA